ncbi:Werner Syndrome-like exonuclease [Senna tora]|uniref:Werner Syndrome-like exonuclease n=1 Tax=Senna tora TaxID=362788 RepID=A0A834SWR4_9FABA|nr:Werner Syndrome-like exonuclease [Senna tora]
MSSISHITKLYSINFYGDEIQTLVTSSSAAVDQWILSIYNLYPHRRRNLIVGLDTEWYPSFSDEITNPVAIIQLCIGNRCLIFQYLHADAIPVSLMRFLESRDFTFVGVGVEDDAKKLMRDHGLRVLATVDVRDMAAEKYGDLGMKRLGLKKLAFALTGKMMKKPKEITLSDWNCRKLSFAQVEYACIDAYVSFLLGVLILPTVSAGNSDKVHYFIE